MKYLKGSVLVAFKLYFKIKSLVHNGLFGAENDRQTNRTLKRLKGIGYGNCILVIIVFRTVNVGACGLILGKLTGSHRSLKGHQCIVSGNCRVIIDISVVNCRPFGIVKSRNSDRVGGSGITVFGVNRIIQCRRRKPKWHGDRSGQSKGQSCSDCFFNKVHLLFLLFKCFKRCRKNPVSI